MVPADIRSLCALLPGATRDIKWRTEEVFSVAGKMFCVLSHGVKASCGVVLKVAPDRFLELTDQPGIRPAPYLARHGWIRLDVPEALPSATLAALLTESYQLVRAKLPRKTRNSLPLGPDVSFHA
jgi:predicted DNA-binding protein (MmcQ/YjbR family)